MEGIVVPCTREKIWDTQQDVGTVAARDAYIKPAFRAWRSHAEQSGRPWFILSTKYGLVHPSQPIENYNIPVSTACRDLQFLELLKCQARELNLDQFDQIVLLDWERFLPLIEEAVRDLNVQCVLQTLQY